MMQLDTEVMFERQATTLLKLKVPGHIWPFPRACKLEILRLAPLVHVRPVCQFSLSPNRVGKYTGLPISKWMLAVKREEAGALELLKRLVKHVISIRHDGLQAVSACSIKE